MKLDSLNRWLMLVANVGVMAGVVFLAVEIGQNQAALDLSNQISILDARALEIQQYNDFNNSISQSREMAEIWSTGLAGEELDSIDAQRFDRLCESYVWLSAAAYERSLALGRNTIADFTVKLRGELLRDSPGFRHCWRAQKEIIRGYGLASYIDAVEEVAGSIE
jgi:hypothetical protein